VSFVTLDPTHPTACCGSRLPSQPVLRNPGRLLLIDIPWNYYERATYGENIDFANLKGFEHSAPMSGSILAENNTLVTYALKGLLHTNGHHFWTVKHESNGWVEYGKDVNDNRGVLLGATVPTYESTHYLLLYIRSDP